MKPFDDRAPFLDQHANRPATKPQLHHTPPPATLPATAAEIGQAAVGVVLRVPTARRLSSTEPKPANAQAPSESWMRPIG